MTRYQRVLRLFGLMCIAAAAVLAWGKAQDARLAALSSTSISQQLEGQTTVKALSSEDGEMPVETIDGVPYIGNLSIPAANLNLPVAAQYNVEQLAQTPTRYNGSYVTGDLVICAHDFPNHFAPLRDLAMGQEIVLKTVNGQSYHYRITNRQVIEPTAVDQVFKDSATDKDWELTLFTCTPTGLARVLVRCRLVSNSPTMVNS